jgi:hypothetical protein
LRQANGLNQVLRERLQRRLLLAILLQSFSGSTKLRISWRGKGKARRSVWVQAKTRAPRFWGDAG